MENCEILEFLKKLEEYFRQNNYSARKIDIVSEARKTIEHTDDVSAIRTQLRNVSILVEQICENQEKHDNSAEKAREAFYDRVQSLLQSGHKKGLEMASDFSDSSHGAFCEVERELEELGEIKAAYNDLVDGNRLEHRVKMIKERYITKISAIQKDFMSDLAAEYDHTMGKIKTLFTGSGAGDFRISEKRAYEIFYSDQDTFGKQIENVGLHVDVAGTVLEDFAKRLRTRTEKIKKRANLTLAIVIALTIILWAGFFAYQNGRIERLVEENIDVTGTVKEMSDNLEGLDVLFKIALENENVAESVNGAVEEPLKAIASTAAKVLVKIYGIIVVCFYIIVVPVFLALKKRRCILKLERSVNEELKIFKDSNGLEQRVTAVSQEIIRKIEGMYAEKYRILCPPHEEMKQGEVVKNEEAGFLADQWKILKIKYGV